MKKKDILISTVLGLAIVIITILAFALNKSEDNLVAVVRVKGVVNQEIVLDGKYETIETGGGYYWTGESGTQRVIVNITLQKDENGIKILSTDCPVKDCMEKGYISKEGESIQCEYGDFSVTIQRQKGYSLK